MLKQTGSSIKIHINGKQENMTLHEQEQFGDHPSFPSDSMCLSGKEWTSWESLV